MSTFPHNIGGEATCKVGIRPLVSAAAGSFGVAGVSIDRQSILSALLIVSLGAVTGAPSAIAVDVKLQESDDNSTFTDVPSGAITTLTAANTNGFLAVDLAGRKRFIKPVGQVAFTGGTSPTIGLSAHLVLGGLLTIPPTHA
jgi:hypothetical protein